MIKYVLHPGWVRSRTDGQDHYITAAELARLYGVPRNECYTVDDRPASSLWGKGPGLTHLWPDETGRYQLPAGGNQ